LVCGIVSTALSLYKHALKTAKLLDAKAGQNSQQQQQPSPILPVHGDLGATPRSNHSQQLNSPRPPIAFFSPAFSSTPRTDAPSFFVPPPPQTSREGPSCSTSSSSLSSPPSSPGNTPRSAELVKGVQDISPVANCSENDDSFVISLFAFQGNDQEDLALEEGQKIRVLSRTPPNYVGDDWWIGELQNGQQGVFPRIWVLGIGDSVETDGLPNPAHNGQLGKIVTIDFERAEALVKTPHQEPQLLPTINLKLVTEANLGRT